MKTYPTSIISSRVFGEHNRYRVDILATRFGGVEFFLLDADTSGEPFVTAQSNSLSGILAKLPKDEQDEFLLARPTKNQIAVNLDKHPVRVVRKDTRKEHNRGFLVECLGTKQRWYASETNLVLAG